MASAPKSRGLGSTVVPSAEGYDAATYYRGEAASRYDEARTMSSFARRKWAAEETALAATVRAFEPGNMVLDLPCGTGRFDELLTHHGLSIVGADISIDMMRAVQTPTSVVPRIQANAMRLPLPDRSVPYTLCGRFLNLIPLTAVLDVLTELRRVTEHAVVIEVRVRRDLPAARFVRLGTRWRSKMSRQLRRGSVPSAAMPEREPIKVHVEADLLEVVRRAGWREVDRQEAVYTRMLVRPDPLYFMVLKPK